MQLRNLHHAITRHTYLLDANINVQLFNAIEDSLLDQLHWYADTSHRELNEKIDIQLSEGVYAVK